MANRPNGFCLSYPISTLSQQGLNFLHNLQRRSCSTPPRIALTTPALSLLAHSLESHRHNGRRPNSVKAAWVTDAITGIFSLIKPTRTISSKASCRFFLGRTPAITRSGEEAFLGGFCML